jgi:hypothetical protein
MLSNISSLKAPTPSLIETARVATDLHPLPINPSWIIEGNPKQGRGNYPRVRIYAYGQSFGNVPKVDSIGITAAMRRFLSLKGRLFLKAIACRQHAMAWATLFYSARARMCVGTLRGM